MRSAEGKDASAVAPDWLWAGRVPSLDGLRALAVGLVLVNHARGTVNAPFPFATWVFGDFGVQLFFVISGFLITLLLIRERRRQGFISLKQFYLRRAIRIVPALAAYLGFVAVLQLSGIAVVDARNWRHIATFTHNFQADPYRQWVVAHLWSLSIEEHFYLLWPPLIAWVGVRWSWKAAWACILSAPAWRWLVGILAPDLVVPTAFTFARMDALAMGACLAIALTGRRGAAIAAFVRTNAVSSWTGGVVLCVGSRLLGTARADEYYLGLLFRHTVSGIGFTLLTAAAVCVPEGRIGRLLNARPVISVGFLSYSLYLWQQPFLNRYRTDWMSTWPLNLVLSVVGAGSSYLLVERPMLRWRRQHGSVAG